MVKIAWDPLYHHPLPENHRFPMEKYSLLPEQLIFEGTITQDQFFIPEPVTEKQILLCHDEQYWGRLENLQLSPAEIRRTGFPLSKQLIQREITIAGGTVQAARFALVHGVAMNIAGGTHHAFTNRGEGFCLLNDVAIAASVLLEEKLIDSAMVIDLDVHQGNGTAEIFQSNPNVFTFSMHGKKNYPLHKECSDLDVELEDGISDDEYLNLLNKHLNYLKENVKSEFIFYQAGVDVLSTDKLGRLGLTIQGCRERDRLVFDMAFQLNLPIVVTMGGGYSERIADIIEAHANTFRLAKAFWD
jgi:acetoin utilization deacetylase AcuC-like enzyme